MEREIDLKKISDGKLYTNKDMVKAGCGECQGCSDCCRGMGNSIFLDPMDIYRLPLFPAVSLFRNTVVVFVKYPLPFTALLCVLI